LKNARQDRGCPGLSSRGRWTTTQAPKDTIISIKRLMGRGVGDTECRRCASGRVRHRQPADGTQDSVRVLLGGKELSPVDISALILRKLERCRFRPASDARRDHGARYFTQTPATPHGRHSKGLKIKILEEPAPAAIAFGIESGDETPKTVSSSRQRHLRFRAMGGQHLAPLNLEGDMARRRPLTAGVDFAAARSRGGRRSQSAIHGGARSPRPSGV
jgi:hypothetical protein